MRAWRVSYTGSMLTETGRYLMTPCASRSAFRVGSLLGLLCLLPASSALAQGGAIPRVGLGVSISDAGELNVVGGPTTATSVITPTILVPIHLSSRFRVEPEVGYFQNSYTSTSGVVSQTTTDTSARFGAGAFLLTSAQRFTLSYGVRAAYLRNSQSFAGASSSANSSTTVPGFLVAPAIGGEYFLSDRLSLGGEVQLRFTSLKATTAATFPATSTATTSSTHGAFVYGSMFGASQW